MRKETAEAAAGTPSRIKAIGIMCAAVTLFACLDASAKFLMNKAGLPPQQVIWIRLAGQLLVIFAVVGPRSIPALFRTNRPGGQLLRSVCLFGATACNFIALSHLRLDLQITIQFLAPLVIALAAGPLLGEWVGWRRLVAIIIGFLGIAVVIRPGYAPLHWAYAFSFTGLSFYVGFALLTRWLAHHDRAEVTLTLSLVVGCVAMIPFAVASWVSPMSALTWAAMLLPGIMGAAGHYLFIIAHRMAPASILAPFGYFGLIPATGLSYLIFGDHPDIWALVGALVVIASGIYLFSRERALAVEKAKG